MWIMGEGGIEKSNYECKLENNCQTIFVCRVSRARKILVRFKLSLSLVLRHFPH